MLHKYVKTKQNKNTYLQHLLLSIYMYIYINLATHQGIPGGRGTEQIALSSSPE